MANMRTKQAHQRAQRAADLGLILVLAAEDADFAADLRTIWPTLPDWRHVEMYVGPNLLGDPNVELVQAWLCGETGELLIQFTMGPIDQLDHSSRLANYGSKMGIDATRKWPEEGFTRPWPDVIKMDEAVKQRVDAICKQLGL